MIFKAPHLLSLLILLLSLCLPSLAVRRDLETEVLRCLDGCNDEDVQEYIACHKECELQYREREERREEEERPGSRELDPRWQPRHHGRGGGGGGEWEPEGPHGEWEPERDPRGEYDHCRRLCEPFKRREQERCWEQCEERERAGEQPWHRGHGSGGEWEPEGPRGEREPARDPRGEYDQCRRLCEPFKQQEREQCEERERAGEQQRDREREREVNDGVRNLPGDPSRSERYEQCERACERQAGGQLRQLCKFRCRQQREREERERHGGGGDVNLLLGIIYFAKFSSAKILLYKIGHAKLV